MGRGEGRSPAIRARGKSVEHCAQPRFRRDAGGADHRDHHARRNFSAAAVVARAGQTWFWKQRKERGLMAAGFRPYFTLSSILFFSSVEPSWKASCALATL